MLRFSFRCFFQNTASLFVPPTARGAVPRGLRLHGTVTAFKHRRGYGFVLAEGIARASTPRTDKNAEAATTDAAPAQPASATDSAASVAATAADKEWIGEYFFTRSALGGGFYVTEGERISFGVRPLTPEQLEARRQNAIRRGTAPDGENAAETAGSASSAMHVASRVRLYDSKTGVESPIVPPTLSGKVVEWDAATSEGVISELDTRGYYHADAPRFAFALEDVDLAPGAQLGVGRFVRFASVADAPASASLAGVDTDDGARADGGLPRAERVIIDAGNERRHAVRGAPISTDTATTRFHGVVRDVIDGKFGFILDDLSGDSIFFHIHNTARGSQLAGGDHVSYLLREITVGKHAGKKSCLNVRPDDGDSIADESSVDEGSASVHSSSSARSSASGFGGPRRGARGRKPQSAHQQQRRRAPAEEEEEDDFRLLD